ncbi:hypothetical protein LEP1GSC050_2811 [Leptospira broomii serovar Hurstbridge str. 5399]|uniref:DUF7954 domain-containing protein n=1 Tax=Leptospira broomii serovar Hurstbridge str. 5399 TaxID=1049789 RepID=T0FDH5_9LEPT|nr:hypothetical protein [Leptospira broomii]EQA45926.1 hypothetical protein LEP1GSC050_2811 [Leptospira broomii serovar Hurstbridge str. 5399]
MVDPNFDIIKSKINILVRIYFNFIKLSILIFGLTISLIELRAESYPFLDTWEGEYIYYLDHRYPRNLRIVGILKVDDSTVFVRSKSVNSNEVTIVSAKISLKDGVIAFKPDKEYAGSASRDNQYVFLDLANWGLLNPKVPSTQLSTIDTYSLSDPWPEFNYTLNFKYAYWAPLFKIISISHLESKGVKGFKVIKIGRIGREVDEFLQFEYESLKVKLPAKQDYKVPVAEKTVLTVDGVKLPLDRNWKTEEQLGIRKSLSPTYGIDLKSKRDAEMSVQKIPIEKGTNTDAVIRRYLSGIDGIDYDSIHHSLYKGFSKIEFNTFMKSRQPNRFSYIFIPGDEFVRVIAFSSFLSAYISNTNYFEKILQAIEIEPI